MTDDPPFRPFTLEEVQRISGASPAVLDAWVQKVLPVRRGEMSQSHVFGLDWMQTFGAFVGKRWLDEGAGLARATKAMAVCAGTQYEGLIAELRKGNSWPAAASGGPNLFIVPPGNKAGATLNLKVLLAEFRARLAKVFPNG